MRKTKNELLPYKSTLDIIFKSMKYQKLELKHMLYPDASVQMIDSCNNIGC